MILIEVKTFILNRFLSIDIGNRYSAMTDIDYYRLLVYRLTMSGILTAWQPHNVTPSQPHNLMSQLYSLTTSKLTASLLKAKYSLLSFAYSMRSSKYIKQHARKYKRHKLKLTLKEAVKGNKDRSGSSCEKQFSFKLQFPRPHLFLT